MTGLFFLGVINSPADVREIIVFFELVHQIELQSPNDIGGVLNVAGFLKALERNGIRIVDAIETADDDERCIGVALKFLQLAN